MFGPFGRNEGIVGQQAHSHGFGGFGNVGTDFPQSDNPQGFFVNFGTNILFAIPLPLFDGMVGVGDVARQGQHHGDGVFGRGDRIALRRVDDDDSLAGGGGDIHVIDPNSSATDNFELRPGGNDFFGDLGSRSNHQGIVFGNHRHQF